jgi:hypothetical protein
MGVEMGEITKLDDLPQTFGRIPCISCMWGLVQLQIESNTTYSKHKELVQSVIEQNTTYSKRFNLQLNKTPYTANTRNWFNLQLNKTPHTANVKNPPTCLW